MIIENLQRIMVVMDLVSKRMGKIKNFSFILSAKSQGLWYCKFMGQSESMSTCQATRLAQQDLDCLD